ncbi:MAG: hypothetical protein HYS69_15455, partial [candidate division NC10 bacterium]|nr:hypothetical protein [candidate division NC10 bacterium]
MPHTHAGTVPPDLGLGTPLFCPAPASGWVPDMLPPEPTRLRLVAEKRPILSGVTGFLPEYFGSGEDFNVGLRFFLTDA